jgi:Zn-dependent protease with chaperone function
MAAAMAAVSAFMQQEQEAYADAVAAAMAPPEPPASDLNLWGQSGRQGMMTMRSLMQMKAFDRVR